MENHKLKAVINDTKEIAISKFVLKVTEGAWGTRIAGMIDWNYSMDVLGLDDSAKKEIKDLGTFNLHISEAPVLKLEASVDSINNATMSGSCILRFWVIIKALD